MTMNTKTPPPPPGDKSNPQPPTVTDASSSPASAAGPSSLPASKPSILPKDYSGPFPDVMKLSVDSIAPEFKRTNLSQDQVTKVIDYLASNFLLKREQVLVGIILLFLKGAANNSTPITLSVEIDGKEISKRDLQNAYGLVTSNAYLRRLAEALAVEIGTYAELNGLKGELAQRVETSLRAEKGETLSSKELAWCSSFSQQLPDLAQRASDRLCILLAADYSKRFSSIANKTKKSGKKENEKDKSSNTKPKSKGQSAKGPSNKGKRAKKSS